MEKMLLRGHSFRNSRTHRWIAVGVSLLLTLALSGTALAQQIAVSGTVTSASGNPLRGVTVRVQGTEIRAFTNSSGRYSIAAPPDATLNFTVLGQRAASQAVGGRTTIDVTMEPIAFLEEVVVTAYSEEQRRGEITGAVSSVNLDAVSRQTSASVLQRLDASVPGITVDASGSPGSRSTVRIRGISSFQNNDPLYIVDGTPVNDSYVNWLNPNDISSVQVLKDASSASIYGARASNGVVIIETTKRGVGGPPRATLRVRTGVAAPVKGYDDFLITNALQYAEVVRLAYVNAGEAVPTNVYGDPANPTIPAYTYAHPSVVTATDAWGRPTAVNTAGYAFPDVLIMPGSAGTNWWKAVFSPAPLADYNLDVNGGSEDNAYAVSFNYFDQTGTAAFNHFKRGSVRVNTSFDRNRFSFGENISLGLERSNGGLPNDPGTYAEDGILGKNILMQPVISVYDIGGNFGSGKSATLGNQSNPLKFAFSHKDDENKTDRIFGNMFAGYDITPELSVRTKLGFNLGQQNQVTFNPIFPENSEANFKNSFNERTDQFIDWTLSNTAKYVRSFSGQHNLSVLLGQEANRITTRFNASGISGLINTDINSRYLQDFLGDASSLTVNSGGSKSALLSVFGKADYTFLDRYVASVTLRKDGSSRMGPTHRWGTFPAFGLGWRLSQEPFMAGNKMFNDVMLRFGWGVTGNQQIPGGRTVAGFGGTRGDTYYDIDGTNTTVVTGFKQTSLGNPDLKWEESRSTNWGADVAMFDNAVNIVLDVYTRNTNNLLFDPPQPATAGTADPPIMNVGSMRNNGIDFSIGHRAASWNVTLNGSHYSNKIVKIDGVQDFFYGPISTRYGNQIINKVGHPIGSFYGLVTDGFYNTQAEADAHLLSPAGTCTTAPCQAGTDPGRFKFKDVDGDGVITLADRTIIGSPHPDFTGGLDLGYRRGDWDVSATLFGTFGNEIFDVQKEFYIFRNFSTNVRQDLVANSWSPTNTNAKYPQIDKNDSQSTQVSNFYVEDGSYVRLRNVQLGYNVPPKYSRWLASTRLYVQAENLFTITGYPGLDPALPAANVFGPAGDIRDQYRGVDRGTYPNNRTFSFGLITNF